MDKKTIEDLAKKLLNGTISPAEESLLNDWYEDLSEDIAIVMSDTEMRTEFKDNMFQKIEERAFVKKTGKAIYSKIKRLAIYGGSAAALILLLLGLWQPRQSNDINTNKTEFNILTDVKPGGNKAVLTLSNGQKIILDSAANGQSINTGSATATKTDNGSLVYKPNAKNTGMTMTYNTLSTPIGGKYKLTLPDGTQVWLNASSSIRYPTAFLGKERKVEVTGEAYFEVIHNVSQPFSVKIGNIEVQDVGTHFNINGYDDEPERKVTLLEGAVNIKEPMSRINHYLKPGDQAKINAIGNTKVVNNVNAQAAIAWKNDLFNFNGMDLKGIMRQLQRWYNISVIYAPGIPDYKFGGDTYMNTNLSEVLKVLELNGIHFKTQKGGANATTTLIVEP